MALPAPWHRQSPYRRPPAWPSRRKRPDRCLGRAGYRRKDLPGHPTPPRPWCSPFLHISPAQRQSHNGAMKIQFPNIAIVGTGAMGRGIAQIAAQAGSQVFLLDANPGAADAAKAALQEQWNKLVAKGRIDAPQAGDLTARLHPVKVVAELAGCDL